MRSITNKDWYEEGRPAIQYPENEKQLKARFVSFLEDIIANEFDKDA